MPQWLGTSLMSMADATRLSTEQIRAMRRYYYGQVSWLDHLFGALLDWMQERGFLDDTIVAFISDHGTHLGDYGLVQKQTFYEPVVSVPFFFWHPNRIARGVELGEPVETRALLPTLLHLAGFQMPDTRSSLAYELTAGKEPQPRPVFSEFTLGSFRIRHDDRLVMVRDENWKLSLCMDPEPHDGALYNLTDDPMELTNLYGRSEIHPVQQRLTDAIEQHLACVAHVKTSATS